MSYKAVPVESFAGLNLKDDPGSVGWSEAIDLLNVDFDPGRIRSRDGFAKFTTAAAAGAYHTLVPFYKTDGTKQLIAAFGGASGAINALNTSGAVVAAQAFANSTYAAVARMAAPGILERAYVAVSGSGAATVYRWDGSIWSVPPWVGTTPTGRHMAVSADFRMVNARYNGSAAGNNPSTVRFSDPGTPETFGANNYVDVTPGDGEEVMALATWRDLTFAFKQSKFAVFYGTDTDNSGNPIFRNRMVTSQGLAVGPGAAAYRAIAVAPGGIYFSNRRGIWFTSGGPAELVSRAVDPIFRGNVSAFFGSQALNQNAIDKCAMVWHDEKLWFAFPSGTSATNDRVLRLDPQTGAWTLYDFPASSLASFRIADAEELVFSLSGSKLLSPPLPPSLSQASGGTLTDAQSYYYKVTALNAAGETTPSSQSQYIANAAPATPTGVGAALSAGGNLGVRSWYYKVVTDKLSSSGFGIATTSSAPSAEVTADARSGQNTITVSWNVVSGASRYRVYRGTTAGAENQYVMIGSGATTSLVDDGSLIWTSGALPTGAVDALSATLGWNPVSGATGYRVYRGTTSGGQDHFFAPGNVTSFTDTGTAGTAGTPPVTNTAVTATADVARHSSAYTSDGGDGLTTGAGITSRYRSGFSDLGAPEQKTIREWILDGQGAPTFQASHDFGALSTGAAVTLGTAPATSESRYRVARRGRQFSWQIGGLSAWSLWNLTANVREKRRAGVHANA